MLSDFVRNTYAPHRLALSAGYVEQLTVTVRLLEAWHRAPLQIADLTADLIRRFLCSYAQHHAAATVNSKRRCLLTLCRFAGNVIDGIPSIPEPRRLPEAWTVTEVERLLVAARLLTGIVGDVPRRYWWPALILTCYDSAARISALLSTGVGDYHPGERCLVIRGESQKNGCDQLFWLSDQTVAALSPLYDRNRERLFDWPYGRRYLWQFFRRRLVEPTGLPSSRRGMDLFHRLRRTNLSYCAADSLELARQQAGHASARTTARHYIDPRIAHTRSAIDVLPRPADS